MDDFTLLEKEFHKYLKDNDLIEPYNDGIIREVIDFADKLTKGQYKLVNDIYTDKMLDKTEEGDILDWWDIQLKNISISFDEIFGITNYLKQVSNNNAVIKE